VANVNTNPYLFTEEGSFCLKLPYSSGGMIRDKRSYKFTTGGREGIIEGIRQFLRNNKYVLGYIPFIIVQPRFKYTSEAKVNIIILKNYI
jgi:hypothetical protein